MQQCETPDQAAAYWKAHIPSHPYFDCERECLVVFILNTRRRIKGHYLVSIGTMDTILCQRWTPSFGQENAEIKLGSQVPVD